MLQYKRHQCRRCSDINTTSKWSSSDPHLFSPAAGGAEIFRLCGTFGLGLEYFHLAARAGDDIRCEYVGV